MSSTSHHKLWIVSGGTVTSTALDDGWQVGIEFGSLSGVRATRYMTCKQARELSRALADAADHYERVRQEAPVRDMGAEAKEVNLRG